MTLPLTLIFMFLAPLIYKFVLCKVKLHLGLISYSITGPICYHTLNPVKDQPDLLSDRYILWILKLRKHRHQPLSSHFPNLYPPQYCHRSSIRECQILQVLVLP